MSRGRSARSGPQRRAAPARRSERPGPLAQLLVPLLVLTAPVWVLALRHALSPLIAINAVGPDVALVAVVAVAWTRAPFAAVLFATALGLGLDLCSDTPWGLGGARMGALAAVFVRLRRGVALAELPGGKALLVFGFALLERSLAALTLKAFVPEVELAHLLPRAAWIALYTAALAPIGFAVAARLNLREGARR